MNSHSKPNQIFHIAQEQILLYKLSQCLPSHLSPITSSWIMSVCCLTFQVDLHVDLPNSAGTKSRRPNLRLLHNCAGMWSVNDVVLLGIDADVVDFPLAAAPEKEISWLGRLHRDFLAVVVLVPGNTVCYLVSLFIICFGDTASLTDNLSCSLVNASARKA